MEYFSWNGQLVELHIELTPTQLQPIIHVGCTVLSTTISIKTHSYKGQSSQVSPSRTVLGIRVRLHICLQEYWEWRVYYRVKPIDWPLTSQTNWPLHPQCTVLEVIHAKWSQGLPDQHSGRPRCSYQLGPAIKSVSTKPWGSVPLARQDSPHPYRVQTYLESLNWLPTRPLSYTVQSGSACSRLQNEIANLVGQDHSIDSLGPIVDISVFVSW